MGLYLKKDHRKKFRVEYRKFFGKYLKKTGHREFGVPGNVIYKKALYISCKLMHVGVCLSASI